MVCDRICQENILDLANGLAGGFTFITMIIALTQIARHLVHYTNPYFQNKIIIIIFMAPFYSLTSFFTIVFHDSKGYFALFRDIYEAVLIYAFFNLLALYLAYDAQTKDVDYERIYEMLLTKGVKEHLWPMNYCLKPIALISKIRTRWYFRQSRLFILQYLAIKPTVTFLLIIVYIIDENSSIAILLKSIVFVSVCISVYYLVLFYQLLKEELAFARPLLKFLSVKGVLFFTFWQNFVIDLLRPQIISQFKGLTMEDEKFVLEVCENLLVCFEMVILAIMTTIAFSHKDFVETQRLSYQPVPSGVRDLTKRFMNNVVTDNFVTAFEELKELKEPLKDPFKSYRNGNVQQEELMTMSSKLKLGLISEDAETQVKVNIMEKPRVIPDFISGSAKKSSRSSDEDRA